jgi:hypothetical protein
MGRSTGSPSIGARPIAPWFRKEIEEQSHDKLAGEHGMTSRKDRVTIGSRMRISRITWNGSTRYRASRIGNKLNSWLVATENITLP